MSSPPFCCPATWVYKFVWKVPAIIFCIVKSQHLRETSEREVKVRALPCLKFVEGGASNLIWTAVQLERGRDEHTPQQRKPLLLATAAGAGFFLSS